MEGGKRISNSRCAGMAPSWSGMLMGSENLLPSNHIISLPFFVFSVKIHRLIQKIMTNVIKLLFKEFLSLPLQDNSRNCRMFLQKNRIEVNKSNQE